MAQNTEDVKTRYVKIMLIRERLNDKIANI